MAWSISVAQLPIPLTTGIYHNIILITNDAQQVVAEINGGPVANGQMVPINNWLSPLAYSGAFNLGVQINNPAVDGFLFYNPSNSSIQLLPPLFTGTQQQVSARLEAAISCAGDINASGQKYVPLGMGTGAILDPSTGQPTTVGASNSNGVADNLLRCMGITPTDPQIKGQPGSNDLVLPDSTIHQVIDEVNQNKGPSDKVPYPDSRPENRTDNSDGSYDITTTDANGTLLSEQKFDAMGHLVEGT